MPSPAFDAQHITGLHSAGPECLSACLCWQATALQTRNSLVCDILIAPGWVQVPEGTFSRPLPTARAIEAAGYDLDAVELPAAAITPQHAAAAPEEAAAAAGAA